MMTDRKEFMIKVWLSCKTEDQRRNVEKWINRVAERFPSKEHRSITDFIDEMRYAWEPSSGPPKEEDYLKALNRSVKDLNNRVSKLEWRVKQ
jgi:hypothetical protein